MLLKGLASMMYYLIRPDRSLKWLDFPRSAWTAVFEAGTDLSDIEWDAAERKLDTTTLRLAFREGIACREGIAVAVEDLLPHDELEKMRNLNPIRESMPGEDLVEALIPGSREQGQALNRRVNESRETFLANAETELERALAVSPKDSLVDHWRSLGGFVPTPM